jgi:pectinesterase
VYAERQGLALAMDLYYPESGREPVPGVVLIHGEDPSGRDRTHHGSLAGQLSAFGFVAATIEYRGARVAPYPAAIEDAMDAVRWLRDNAPEYRLNSSAIGAVGENFGGYLAAMLGVVSEFPLQGSSGARSGHNPMVQAVVAIHSMLDLPAYNESVEFPWYLHIFLGFPQRQKPQLWKEASPITYVGPQSAPFLLAHGPEDEQVPLQQSTNMRDALSATGVRADIYSPDGAGNGFADQPQPRLVRNLVQFFRETLAFPPEGVQVIDNLVYASPGGRDLHLDLFVPEAGGELRPGVIFIHGGGWAFGGKSDFRVQAARMAAKGFVTTSIDYRLSSERIYPAAIDDAKAAVRWMRANAATYGIDPDRIGVVGSSAGGHIASLLGVTGDRRRFGEDDDHPGESARVQAVAAISGAYDMVYADTRDEWAPAAFMGGLPSVIPDRWAEASPINHVGTESAAFLFLHGTEDELTPAHQAERMLQKLQDAGVHAEMFYGKGGGHDFFLMHPWGEQVLAAIGDFFKRVLGR